MDEGPCHSSLAIPSNESSPSNPFMPTDDTRAFEDYRNVQRLEVRFREPCGFAFPKDPLQAEDYTPRSRSKLSTWHLEDSDSNRCSTISDRDGATIDFVVLSLAGFGDWVHAPWVRRSLRVRQTLNLPIFPDPGGANSSCCGALADATLTGKIAGSRQTQ